MELMIGVVIMGIALSCFYSALQQGFYMIENSRDINRVSQVLQDEMERLRTMSWYEIGELPESVDFPANSSFLAHYSREFTFSRLVVAEKANQKRVELTCTWSDSCGLSNEATIFSLVTNKGINELYLPSS